MQVWGNLWVEQCDFPRQHFKRRVQFTRQNRDILWANGRGDVITTRKLDQVTIAEHQGIKQCVVHDLHLLDFPVTTVIELGNQICAPLPFAGQFP
ncbi:Uncharacterised protein [Vibrio cholerae]|uniref:Uncharacterized protein n=1 Tax=Vibrio cholerae TaxID=666 RepID=A0A655RB21_VIBCL|nr:Uncharacterised protein [Vibrio cholerae]CSC47121.1 Uncharacterised protein [Vibrio cholerae]CSC53134.1 Uncharacterised protein [Vibrio cholerae]CSC76482.1 Uncharacterised protein [Vibrio cholerae]CSC86050.1 Uncharacterised protein [Vibrio cholerae]